MKNYFVDSIKQYIFSLKICCSTVAANPTLREMWSGEPQAEQDWFPSCHSVLSCHSALFYCKQLFINSKEEFSFLKILSSLKTVHSHRHVYKKMSVNCISYFRGKRVAVLAHCQLFPRDFFF